MFSNIRRARMRLGQLQRLAGVATVMAAALLPSAGHAGTISTITANGYTFTNFDPTLTGTAVGSNVNGISNTGQVVGTTVTAGNTSTFSNFTGTPGNPTPINTGAGQIALGINSAGDVVGGNGITAFVLPHNGVPQTLNVPGGATNAFGINDHGVIVGQYNNGQATPGFILAMNAVSAITINAPIGPNVVNAQGINNNGQVVGFYQGNDGQTHGFTVNQANANNNSVTGNTVADPVIPPVAGEPGAHFVFSQILGINDSGLAVGYYGDSTTSQHGFFYNTTDGMYTFLDDPAAAFSNGVEATQITGINNAGEIAGFYTDANGIAHSFTACPVGVVCPNGVASVPEPTALSSIAFGLGVLGLCYRRRRAAAVGR